MTSSMRFSVVGACAAMWQPFGMFRDQPVKLLTKVGEDRGVEQWSCSILIRAFAPLAFGFVPDEGEGKSSMI